MAKISAKNLILELNGYVFSTYASSYEAQQQSGAIDVTGFSDTAKNYIPGLAMVDMTITMLWDSGAGKTHLILSPMPSNGLATVLPEGYYLGCPTLSMPFMTGNYSPKGTPSTALEVGQIKLENYSSDYGIERGVALTHGIITATTTGTGVLDPTNAAVTAICGGTLQIWTPTTTDTYVVKIQHSPDNSTWADLITFVSNGTSVTAERIANASGTVNKYRRVLATRTGSAGDSFGFTIHFFHL